MEIKIIENNAILEIVSNVYNKQFIIQKLIDNVQDLNYRLMSIDGEIFFKLVIYFSEEYNKFENELYLVSYQCTGKDTNYYLDKMFEVLEKLGQAFNVLHTYIVYNGLNVNNIMDSINTPITEYFNNKDYHWASDYIYQHNIFDYDEYCEPDFDYTGIEEILNCKDKDSLNDFKIWYEKKDKFLEKFIPKILKHNEFSNIYDLEKEVKKNKGAWFEDYSSLHVDYYIDYDYGYELLKMIFTFKKYDNKRLEYTVMLRKS